MTLKEAVELAAASLSSVSDSAKLDAQLLACYACNITQTTIIAHPNQTLTTQQLELFKTSLNKRTKGEPLAYITGSKEFWSLEFNVNKHVLVPRPETELLVELTLNMISNLERPRILELGTGSGAVAISIANERSDCYMIASDVSQHALEVAKDNALKHKTKINFIKSNWYENIPKEKFDVIVSNPPYVASNDPHLENNVLRYEPENAVISGDDGLEDIQKIILGATTYLSNKGYLLLEHGFQQNEKVQNLFKKNSLHKITTHKDFLGNSRATSGTMCN